MITITFDQALIESQMQRLAKVPYAVQRALYPAISEVLRIARSELASQLVSDIPLPPRLIEKSIRLSQAIASGQSVAGSLTVASKLIPLINYDVDPQVVTARKGMRSKTWPGFSYALRSGERREREQLPGQFRASLPFIAQVRNSSGRRRNGAVYEAQAGAGPLGVYYRTAFGQLKEAYGPAVQYHATTPQVEQMLMAGAEENFARILPRIVDTALTAHGGNHDH